MQACHASILGLMLGTYQYLLSIGLCASNALLGCYIEVHYDMMDMCSSV